MNVHNDINNSIWCNSRSNSTYIYIGSLCQNFSDCREDGIQASCGIFWVKCSRSNNGFVPRQPQYLRFGLYCRYYVGILCTQFSLLITKTVFVYLNIVEVPVIFGLLNLFKNSSVVRIIFFSLIHLFHFYLTTSP